MPDRALDRRRARSLTTSLLALLSLLAQARPAGAEAVYTGSQVRVAADNSIDVMKDHVRFQATQDRYDAMLGYFAFTGRFSPMTFANADGTKTSKTGFRYSEIVGGGYGAPSQWGLYGGAWIDLLQVGPTSNQALQGLAFGGVAALGFQVTYGAFVSEKFATGLDPYGHFNPRGGGNVDYTYVPGSKASGLGAGKEALSIYHTSGASLVAIRYAEGFGTVRAQLQPLKQWLDERFGLPIIAVQQLRSTVDQFSGPKEIASLGGVKDTARATAADAVPDIPKAYEVELGSDNMLNAGIRAHGVARFASTGFKARAEAGAYHDFPWGTVAFRSFVFARDATVTASLDSFAQWSIIKEGPPGQVGFPIAASVSYSYNSPESSTFLPLPYAHVFGVQLIVGVPDVAKRVVPIVRPKFDANRSGSASTGVSP